MFNFFKNRAKRLREQKEREFEEWLAKKNEADTKAERERKQHEDELRQAALKLETERLEAVKNSNEPWANVEWGDIDENGRIGVKLDWNTAMIEYLKKECNFSGTDDEIMQKYLGAIYREIYMDSKNDTLNIFKEYPDSPSAKNAPEALPALEHKPE